MGRCVKEGRVQMREEGGNEEADSMGTKTGPFLPAEDYRQLFGRHPDTWSCYQVAANGALRGL